ncbi:MAG: DUF937 domain-containing protein [Phycisphaerales bacterium]
MLDQLIQQVLGDKKSDLISMLTSKLGVNDGQAGGFLEMLVPQVMGMLKGDKLDVSSLMAGKTDTLKQGLDLEALGGLLGGGKEKAETAVDAVAGPIGEQLQGMGDLSSVMGMLDDGKDGGIDDMVRKAGGGLLGKMFGK